jgi:hypothetical protein
LKDMTLVNAPTRSWRNISANSPPFKLTAGLYELTVHAEAWSGGSVTLQRLSFDGSVFSTSFKSFSADGLVRAYVPSGAYQLTIVKTTRVSAELVLLDDLNCNAV